MNKALVGGMALILWGGSICADAADFNSRQVVTRLAFGSCNAPEFAQPIWTAVADSDPDMWIWTGDIVYADTTDIRRTRSLYRMQEDYFRYRDLREDVIVLGTWDDHDYGANNAGKDYPAKKQSQAAILDFLDEPPDSPRRQREGIYASYRYGKTGRLLKIILLDLRYHRDPPGPKSSILGDRQWQWLESTLHKNDADLTLLVSSTVVLPTQVGDEKWAQYPRDKARLWAALQRSPSPVVIVSGDKHIGEISKLEDFTRTWPLYEISASGMTHSITGARYPNALRVGHLYTGLNFGLIEIDWHRKETVVTLQIRDADGRVRIGDRVRLPKPRQAPGR
jgi:alkaline phosphatase D